MMRVERIRERQAWDALVLASRDCHITQSYGWGEARAHTGWEPVRMAAFAGADCVATMCAYRRRVPGLGAVLDGPRVPLLAAGDDRAWVALPALLRALGAETRAIFIRISPGVTSSDPAYAARLAACGFAPLPEPWTDWNTPRTVMRLSLAGSEQDVFRRMAKKRRQQIASVERTGVVVESGSDLDTLRVFYRMLAEHASRQRYPVRGWAHFEALHRQFGRDGLMVFVGRVAGEPVSAQLGLRFGAVAYSLFAPSTAAARTSGANEVVQWQWIRWAHAAACTAMDFGPSATPGIARFKVELGCRPEVYAPYHDYAFSPRRYGLARCLERRALPRLRPLAGRIHQLLRSRARPVATPAS
ncbi:MAG: lipid II:glycine glycyltransferase FemX, partial [Candidatus Rokuibacteriota bacterium]